MKFRQLTDLFRDKQPKMTFTEELSKPLHTEMPPRWNSAPVKEGEIDFSEVDLVFDFKDELLETAYADFKVFLDVMQIKVCKKALMTRRASLHIPILTSVTRSVPCIWRRCGISIRI